MERRSAAGHPGGGNARIDAAYLTRIRDSRTVGESRRKPPAWRVAAEHRENALEEETDSASALLDDRTPYEPPAWFGDDGIAYVMPLARLRTAQIAPDVIESLAREDHAIGMDYEPAPWWSVEDKAPVVAALEESGCLVRRDDALIARYSNY